jgi:predicted small lipoprotein YifL
MTRLISATALVFMTTLAACGSNAPPAPPPVAPPEAFRFDEETVARSRDKAFDGFKAQVRAFRALTKDAAAIQAKAKTGGLTDADRARLDELDGRIAAALAAINETMADPRADELDRRAMRYLFGAPDSSLAASNAQ